MASLEDEFGDIVRKARQGLEMAVASLAAATGIAGAHIEAMEGYRRQPAEAECAALADALSLDAGALWQVAQGSYDPGPPALPEGVEVTPFRFPRMNSNAYLVHVESTGVRLLIDPGGDATPILETIARSGGRLDAILVTHGHSDHVEGLEQVRRAHAVPVYACAREWSGAGLVDIDGRDKFAVAGTAVRVLPCPGHTPAGVTLLIAGVAATGDTLFAGSLGGAHRGERNLYQDLLRSARAITDLPEATLLLPGHGPATSVALERQHNPFLATAYAGTR